MKVHYGYISDKQKCVCKSWYRPPGFSRDFRGWAVMINGREISLYGTATDAYSALDKMK
jgi:hypothetical protein